MRAVSQPSCGVRLREPWAAACTGALALPNNPVVSLSTVVTQRGLVGLQDAGASGTQFTVNASRALLGSVTAVWMCQLKWEGNTAFRCQSTDGTKGLSLYRNGGATVMAAYAGYTWNPTSLSFGTYIPGLTPVFAVCHYDHAAKTVTLYAPNGTSSTAGALSGTYTPPTSPVMTGNFSNSSISQLELAAVAEGLVSPALIFKDPWGTIFEKPPRWLYTGMGSGSWTPLEVTG